MSRGPVDHPAAAYPSWLAAPRVPLTVVAGPPGNGALAWIAARAGPDDQVLDLAEIIEGLSGVPAHRAGGEWTIPALERRNAALARLARGTNHAAAWLVSPSPAAWQRAFWTARGATVVVVDPGLEAALLGARDACIPEYHVHDWYQDANYRQPRSRGRPVVPAAGTKARSLDTTNRGYGRNHIALRDELLAREPHCRMCAEVGRITRADVLDHIEPFTRPDGTKDYKRWGDPRNHRPLCQPCHNSRGATRSRAERPPGAAADGRPLDPSHPWNRA